MIATGLYPDDGLETEHRDIPGYQCHQIIPMHARPLSEVLHHYVVPWLQADWPLDWPLLVGRTAPLVVEIGFGNGLFLLGQAEHRPEVNLIGIELSWRWVQHLAKRL